jgi:hypothetical protein
MDEESDEQLEDTDEVVEPRVQSSSSSENEDDAEATEVAFWATKAGDSSNFLNFTGPPNGINRSAASDINAKSSPFSIFILFFRQVFHIILTETSVLKRLSIIVTFLEKQDKHSIYTIHVHQTQLDTDKCDEHIYFRGCSEPFQVNVTWKRKKKPVCIHYSFPTWKI